MNIHDQDIYFKAKNEGEQQAKIETAKNLLSMNLSIENISKATGLSLDTINELKNQL